MTNLLEIIKQKSIQNVFSVGAVEAFDVGILCRLAGLNVEQIDVFLLCPALQPLGVQLWTVIHANVRGLASPIQQLLQQPHHPFRWEGGVQFNPKCFMIEVIDHIQSPKHPAIGQSITFGSLQNIHNLAF
jgi:hypothetical protein